MHRPACCTPSCGHEILAHREGIPFRVSEQAANKKKPRRANRAVIGGVDDKAYRLLLENAGQISSSRMHFLAPNNLVITAGA